MKYIALAVFGGTLAACHGHAQTSSVVGTISAFKAETTEIEVKPDRGAPVAFKVTGDTVAQKVAPGVTDLKQAHPIKVTDVHLGDRVLATAEAGTMNLRRIVVMSASEIGKRDEADRADWEKRGVTGIVASKSGNQITLKTRTMTGEKQTVVTVTDQTKYKRYAPDSVKFADAKKSRLADIGIGDQVRARGQETAEDVVFGSFVTKAGTITAVDTGAREVTVKDLASGKPLVIRITADSHLKGMLDRAGMIAMMHGSQASAPAPGHAMPPAMMSLNEMLERLPEAKLEDLKTGDIVVVSSTKGAKPDQITAISMLANAEMLLQVMASQASQGATPSATSGLEALSGMGFGTMQ